MSSDLNEDFLNELFKAAFENELVLSTVSQHIDKEILPNQEYIKLHKAISAHYKNYKAIPTWGHILQRFKKDGDVSELIDEIRETEFDGSVESLVDELEVFILDKKTRVFYNEFGKLYKREKQDEAQDMLNDFCKWKEGFSLKNNAFTEVLSTIKTRNTENKIKAAATSSFTQKPINTWGIHELDLMNSGKNLRGHLCFILASTGVGKSHAAVHFGDYYSTLGLNVLHIQLEGSEDEVLNAYSGSFLKKNASVLEKGGLSDEDMDEVDKVLESVKGTVTVRAYQRFNNRVSTTDINSTIMEYRKLNGFNPDVLLVDSADLLTDSSGKFKTAKDERHKRTAVAQDLKDIASDLNILCIATTQSVICEPEWVNDPANMLTEYHLAEGKGAARPLDWLFSLNQTKDEKKDNCMRIGKAKTRHANPGDKMFKIATNYDNGIFYDRIRSETIRRITR